MYICAREGRVLQPVLVALTLCPNGVRERSAGDCNGEIYRQGQLAECEGPMLFNGTDVRKGI